MTSDLTHPYNCQAKYVSWGACGMESPMNRCTTGTAVQWDAAMAQVFILGWTLPISPSCGYFSPFLSCSAAKSMMSVMPL